jgi:hypothetical protein
MKIFQEAFHNNLPNRGMAIENHNFVFLIGDLNYRIKDYTREEVIDMANK